MRTYRGLRDHSCTLLVGSILLLCGAAGKDPFWRISEVWHKSLPNWNKIKKQAGKQTNKETEQNKVLYATRGLFLSFIDLFPLFANLDLIDILICRFVQLS